MQGQQHARDLGLAHVVRPRHDAGRSGDAQIATHRLRVESQHGGDALGRPPGEPQTQHLFHFDHRDLAIRHPLLLPGWEAKPEER